MLVTAYGSEFETDVWEGPDGFNWAIVRIDTDEVVNVGCESNRRDAERAASVAIQNAK